MKKETGKKAKDMERVIQLFCTDPDTGAEMSIVSCAPVEGAMVMIVETANKKRWMHTIITEEL